MSFLITQISSHSDSSAALLNNNNPNDPSRVDVSGASGATNYDDVVIFL